MATAAAGGGKQGSSVLSPPVSPLLDHSGECDTRSQCRGGVHSIQSESDCTEGKVDVLRAQELCTMVIPNPNHGTLEHDIHI